MPLMEGLLSVVTLGVDGLELPPPEPPEEPPLDPPEEPPLDPPEVFFVNLAVVISLATPSLIATVLTVAVDVRVNAPS